jgi:glycosyltransferase involved in cell wall biosynthesis
LNLKKYNIIHYQLNNTFELALIVIINKLFNNRIITTVHSFRPELFNRTEQFLFYLLKSSKVEFVAPTDTIKNLLINNGLKKEKVKVLNTFLPPSESEINKKLSNEIMNFVNERDNIVVANAYKLYRDDLNKDVYGLDMCIEACASIPEINFVFCVPLIKDQIYFKQCVNKINDYNIEDRFMIVNQNISLVSLFKFADLFVRPTSTDSFGISVAEAISMGVPAIASDVCERAKGTITFQSRNTEEFITKIKKTLANKNLYNVKESSNNRIEKYIELYNDKI